MAASMRRVSVVWFVAMALALSLIGTMAAPVRAATIDVNTTLDFDDNDATCSLREAIDAANANVPVGGCAAGDPEPAVDTINVPAGTYVLDYSAEVNGIVIRSSVAIVGLGAAPTDTVIDGNDDDRVFALDGGDGTISVAISNVTITGGSAEDEDGGGIYVDGDATLSLSNSVVIDNHASDAGSGGGIYVEDGTSATISGSNIGTVLSPNTTEEDGGGIYVGEGSSLTINGASTVTGNTAGEDGGGIYLDGNVQQPSTLAITGSTISGNHAESDGGGIFVNDNSTATITGSTISGNSAGDDGVGEGGGLSVDGTATLSGTTVSDNHADDLGGGIYIDSDGTVNLNAASIVSGNDADDGGGIANEGSDTLNMNGSTVSGNEASNGGGIFNSSDATANIVNSTIDSNTATDGDGGGIYSVFCCGGELTITGSTISNNDAEVGSGGGIYSNSGGSNMTSLLNSTVSGNAADQDGGGIFVDGNLETMFSTVASNSAGSEGEGGGIWTQGSAGFYGTVVANNGAAGDCHHNDTGVDTYGSNLDTDDTCDFNHPDDLPDSTAKLDPLAGNPPGTTQTHALQFDSPAVDAVQPASLPDARADFLLVGTRVFPTCPATDQRGVTRPQDGDSNGVPVCDIGAYELLPPTAAINDVSVVEGDSGTVDLIFTVTLSRPSTGTVTIAYATADGTATVVADYQAKTGTVTFAPSDTSETITVKVVGDLIDEPNEAFVVNLTAPVGATLADAQGTGTILDDEGPIVTLAPTPRQDTLGSTTLPDTGTGTGLGGWGAGVAIGLVVFSSAVLIRNRRRQSVRAG